MMRFFDLWEQIWRLTVWGNDGDNTTGVMTTAWKQQKAGVFLAITIDVLGLCITMEGTNELL
jgi:hypothetical protein